MRDHEKPPIIGIAAWRQNVNLLNFPMTIFQIDQEYIKRVRAAGGLPFLVPHVLSEQVYTAIEALDALILTGGDDVDPAYYGAEDEGVGVDVDPEADAREIELVRAAVECGLPVMGVCRGSQIINVAFGGKMTQEMTLNGLNDHPPRPKSLPEILDMRHDLHIERNTRLHGIFGSEHTTVNTTHHQANTDIAPGFRVSGRAPDGTVEAIEPTPDGKYADKYIMGVQWHPEKLPAPQHQELFDDLVRAARDRRSLK